jgi:hypothetical protein
MAVVASENKTNVLLAAAEKIRALFEGKEAVYIEKGAIRVHVNNICCADHGLIQAHIEEIPTAGLPIWIAGGGPARGSHPLQWTIGTNSGTQFSSESWFSPPYVGWFLYFSPKLIEAVVALVSQFPENYSPLLGYSKIRALISSESSNRLKAFLRNAEPS